MTTTTNSEQNNQLHDIVIKKEQDEFNNDREEEKTFYEELNNILRFQEISDAKSIKVEVNDLINKESKLIRGDGIFSGDQNTSNEIIEEVRYNDCRRDENDVTDFSDKKVTSILFKGKEVGMFESGGNENILNKYEINSSLQSEVIIKEEINEEGFNNKGGIENEEENFDSVNLNDDNSKPCGVLMNQIDPKKLSTKVLSKFINIDTDKNLDEKNGIVVIDEEYQHNNQHYLKENKEIDFEYYLKTRAITYEKPFKCDKCKDSFNDREALKSHTISHTRVKSYKCDTCKKTFTKYYYFQKHAKIHIEQKPYKCYICQEKFTTISHLGTHVMIHTEAKSYKCDICEEKFTTISYLETHGKIHTEEKTLKCEEGKLNRGDGIFSSDTSSDIIDEECSNDYRKDEKDVTNFSDKSGKTCIQVLSLYKGNKEVGVFENGGNGNILNKYEINGSLQSEVLNEEGFNNKGGTENEEDFDYVNLREDNSKPCGVLINQIDSKKLSTNVLSKFINNGTDKSLSNLDKKNGEGVIDEEYQLNNQHFLKENKEIDFEYYLKMRAITYKKPFKCDKCKGCFNDREALKRNAITHTRVKSYKCDTCKIEFNTYSNLQKHAKIHTEEKPYKCDICEKKFTTISYLETHAKIHTEEKPYKCNRCKRCFRLGESLRSHAMVHTRVKFFKCDICEKKFMHIGCFKKHIANHTRVKSVKCKLSKKKIHAMIHTGMKPFKCDECGKDFRSRTNLKTHLKIHTETKLFKCSKCNKCFRQLGHLKNHVIANRWKFKCRTK